MLKEIIVPGELLVLAHRAGELPRRPVRLEMLPHVRLLGRPNVAPLALVRAHMGLEMLSEMAPCQLCFTLPGTCCSYLAIVWSGQRRPQEDPVLTSTQVQVYVLPFLIMYVSRGGMSSSS